MKVDIADVKKHDLAFCLDQATSMSKGHYLVEVVGVKIYGQSKKTNQRQRANDDL